ncbi:hypothetical protein LTR72_012476, partial [Exophiala xenobiotica]
MPTSTRGRRAPTPPTTQQQTPSKRARKPSARLIEQQETEELLIAETISVSGDHDDDAARDDGGSNLPALVQLITELKEIIQQQSSIIADQNNGIERLETELVEIKAEQQNIKSQNSELQEEVRSLRTQFDSYSASLPSTRSWASVVASGRTTQSTTIPSLTTGSGPVKVEPKCLRVSTQARNDEGDATDDSFARYLPTHVANERIRNALRNSDATRD